MVIKAIFFILFGAKLLIMNNAVNNFVRNNYFILRYKNIQNCLEIKRSFNKFRS